MSKAEAIKQATRIFYWAAPIARGHVICFEHQDDNAKMSEEIKSLIEVFGGV